MTPLATQHSVLKSQRIVSLLAAGLFVCASAMAQTGAPTSPQPNPVVRMSAGVMAGQLLTRINPVYPQEAKDAHIEGSVIFHAIIAADGTIQSLQLISGPDILAKSAWAAVKDWTYKPYLLNGVPTAVDTTITVNYTFSNPGGL